ncbi:DUF2478 domain-containing protein [Tropicibacter naphthalenivorans]|uniref:ABC-type molybdate transport system, ATPase component n=1 Tax=Tropicibacter naphthalenivorans TaxID=441103 RepID=A0A0P1GYI3_9RHOB|nr:DUF2478 domain-containing protein [Tropicibacter naphthalenivorans]CUH81263.1 ABC-type molybdate transport system, ATPase component [Tropicibacter naphthalenivorans]SMC98024.1 Protein of unknown function [Tropicibacter naphthalenivorans]
MTLAYVLAGKDSGTNTLFDDLAKALTAKGMRLAGTVQINTEKAAQDLCDMDVRVLPDGPMIRISQDLGGASRGCRLDPAALEQAVGLTSEAVANGADLLIVNKFGKHEAEGRGFRETIGEALALDIPVLVAVNPGNLPVFQVFSGGLETALPAELGALTTWAQSLHAEEAA